MTWSDDGKVSLGVMAPTQGEHQCLEQIDTILPRVAGGSIFWLIHVMSILFLYIIIWILRGRAGG